MSTLSLRLPESLHKQLRDLARREGVSINQLISSAVGEKMAALMTVAYLKERGARGRRRQFDAILGRVPDVEPAPGDDLDTGRGRATVRHRRARRPR